jgi:hypothetical protein
VCVGRVEVVGNVVSAGTCVDVDGMNFETNVGVVTVESVMHDG